MESKKVITLHPEFFNDKKNNNIIKNKKKTHSQPPKKRNKMIKPNKLKKHLLSKIKDFQNKNNVEQNTIHSNSSNYMKHSKISNEPSTESNDFQRSMDYLRELSHKKQKDKINKKTKKYKKKNNNNNNNNNNNHNYNHNHNHNHNHNNNHLLEI